MYIDKLNIKVLGTTYGPNNKEKKGQTLSEFKFDDGITSKELSKFLESLQDQLSGHIYGRCTGSIVINKDEEHVWEKQ